jgi:acyl dehydratase
MNGFRYFWEDFPAGRRFEYGRRALSEEEIIEFARQWDPQRFHVDPQAAKETPFGGLVASGWHTGCVMMRMMCDAYLNESSCIGSPGIEEWRFALPVRPATSSPIARRCSSRVLRRAARTAASSSSAGSS